MSNTAKEKTMKVYSVGFVQNGATHYRTFASDSTRSVKRLARQVFGSDIRIASVEEIHIRQPA